MTFLIMTSLHITVGIQMVSCRWKAAVAVYGHVLFVIGLCMPEDFAASLEINCLKSVWATITNTVQPITISMTV